MTVYRLISHIFLILQVLPTQSHARHVQPATAMTATATRIPSADLHPVARPTAPPLPPHWIRGDTQDVTISQEINATTTTLGVADTVTSSGGGTSTVTVTTSYSLVSATTPIALAATLGLIMPNPWQSLYTDLEYTFGFVDAVPRPAPTYGGWLRQIQPLIILSNNTVDVLPATGTDDPSSSDAVPDGSDGLCGATAENYAIGYPFSFETEGWYMFVVNQTYMQATITSNNTCTFPLLQEQSFFATYSFSISAKPTVSPGPASPTSAYTVWAAVSTATPGSLPIDPEPTTNKQKLAVGLGVGGGAFALAVAVGILWWMRRKRIRQAEILAFSRLKPKDQEEFLRDNPNSFLNPDRPRGTFISQARQRSAAIAGPPPGTMAYAIWSSQQFWNDQVMQRQAPWAWGNGRGVAPQMRSSVMMGQPLQSGWGQPQERSYGQQPLVYNHS